MAEEKVEVEEKTAEEAAPVTTEEKPAEAVAPAEAKAEKDEAPKEKAEAKAEASEEKSKKADAPKEKADAASKAPVEDNKPKLATAAELLADAVVEPIKKRKGSKNIPFGIAFVKTTFNNTIVSITDMRGNVISWSSAGRCNFKGSRKSTAFAATTVAQEAARGAIGHGMTEVEVRVQGPGAGRESAVRAIQSAGLAITTIKDTTAIPHNGCRPPKRRRV
ncbi:MAG: 30S ribosomal protein S11 [Verrucomicrobia bacterium]|nr:30S ribosomal protein S11 [Verrucomicrobiota bacterium]